MKGKKHKGKLLNILISVAALAMLISTGCSETFLITKDGKSYFFGSKREDMYRLLCESGDLKKIIEDTMLSNDIKESLYKYNCIERSPDKVREIYANLEPEQRRDLRLSFQRHGYDINYIACCN